MALQRTFECSRCGYRAEIAVRTAADARRPIAPCPSCGDRDLRSAAAQGMLHGAAIALLELVGFAGGIQSLSILNAVAVAVALRFVGRWYGTGLTFGPRLPNALPPAREINRLRPASPPPSRR